MKNYKINWTNSLFLTLTPILSIVFIYLHITYEGINLYILALLPVFSFLAGISITGGYHRLFAHKSYEAHPILKLFYLIFGASAFENSALNWCRDHRAHHQYTDQNLDPYNIQRGFFYAHMGWILIKEDKDFKEINITDLEQDKLVQWQDKNYFLIGIVSGFIFPTFIGFLLGSPLGGLAILSLFRIVFVHHSTFLINSLCHTWGKTPYTDLNSSKDSLLMAIFTNGEGYHNFHHAFQADYRNGIKWYHWDPTKWFILLNKFIGLTSNLKKTSEIRILKAKFFMQQKYISLKLKNNFDISTCEKIRIEVEHALVRFYQLKADYKNLKRQFRLEYKIFKKQYNFASQNFKAQYKQSQLEIKLKIRDSKKEFHSALSEWRRFIEIQKSY